MQPSREPLRPAAATLLAFAVAGSIDMPTWLFVRDASGAARAEAALFDWLHFLGIGALTAGLVWLALRALCGARQKSPRLVAAGSVLLGYLGSALLGVLTLREDFENFAERQEAVPAAVALWGGVLLVSSAVPLAMIAGRILARFRRTPWTELGALSALVLIVVGNGFVLANDYRGIHLYLALAAIAFCASALTGTQRVPIPRRGLQVAFSVGALCAAVSLLVSPSSAADLALERSVSAAVTPLVGELRSRLGRRSSQDDAALALVPKSEWLAPRDKAPAIPPSKPPLLGKNPIVLLITVDALRADVVTGKYDDKLPTFRSLREHAVWFSEARSAGTLTKVSLAALFQSTYFSQQLWTTNAGPPNVRKDKTPRFPELLQKAGVETVNFRSISWLRNGNVVKGFDEDIDVGAEDRRSYTASKAVFEKLLPRVKRFGNGPTFLWTHLSDPHAPYNLGSKKGSEFDRYVSEVALVDKQLGKLVTTLREAGLEDRTLLVISADHGESFGEHHSDTHGTTVYDETMHVPLFFVAPPGVAKPRKVDELVSLVDLAPTMLDLFGLPTPGHMMGQSLVPFLRGETPQLSRYVAAEARQFRTLITPERKKVIEDLKSGRVELYDLSRDPLELHNLASDREALRLPKATLDAFFKAHALTKNGYERPIVR